MNLFIKIISFFGGSFAGTLASAILLELNNLPTFPIAGAAGLFAGTICWVIVGKRLEK